MACNFPRAILLLGILAVAAAPLAHAIACSPYVNPCQCGLCPNIVNCDTKQIPECFCGRKGVTPGSYAHPSDPKKFWQCSKGPTGTIYGVEVACPGYYLVFDPVLKVCTVADAVTKKKSATPVSG